MITTHKRKYLYPPRANTAIPRDQTNIYANANWIAQLKYNDSHALFDYEDGSLQTVWDRHAGSLTYNFERSALAPALKRLGEALAHMGGGTERYLLDGGLLNDKHMAIKDTIVIWDILIENHTHLIGTTYKDRYNTLTDLVKYFQTEDTTDYGTYTLAEQDAGLIIIPGIILPRCLNQNQWDEAWNAIEKINKPYPNPLIEGLVFKNPNGKLKPAFNERNNSEWMGRSRVTTGRHTF